MKYVGSKNRLAKELVPIIQSYINEDVKGYIEPFVGGANIIDKIKCDNKIGYDFHKQLIALLQHVQMNVNDLPNTISEEEYKKVKYNREIYPDWYVGLVGFCASYSAIYFDTYARSYKNDGVTPRDMPNEAIRNLIKQAPKLKDIKFECKDFREIKDLNNYVIYCDPPYKSTIKYNRAEFPYEEFYDWCREMSKNNIVLISGYWMPDDFKCIWEKEHNTNIYCGWKKANKRVEKLFKLY